MLSVHTILAFWDFDKSFNLYIDACDWQQVATLGQEGTCLEFYSQQLNSVHLNCIFGEKRLLGIIEGFKEFEGMISCQKLAMYTSI